MADTDQPLVQPRRAGRGSRPARRRLAIQVLLTVAVIAVVYLGLLPKLVDVGETWATLRAMTWLELVTLLGAAVWNLASYLLPQLVALPGLTPRQAVLESHTSTAVGNLLPAGQAVGLGVTYRFYTSYGFPPAQITQSLLIQGVWNNFVKLGMPIVALGLLVLTGHAASELAPVAVIGAVVLASALPRSRSRSPVSNAPGVSARRSLRRPRCRGA